MDNLNNLLPKSKNTESNFLNYKKVVAYLNLLEYKKEEHSNYEIYQIDQEEKGNQVEIVIPKDPSVSDIKIYLQSTVQILAALMNKSVNYIIDDINTFDRDILQVINPYVPEAESIPLSIATKQVNELKQLVAYSACSEVESKPYFLNHQKALANRMVEEFRFGHTFKGSFGFTIESPILTSNKFAKQLSIDKDQYEEEVVLPNSRKVMERIVRGLILTRKSSEENNPTLIVESYKDAFNSNMCRAVVNMAGEKQYPLDYSIKWSKIKLPSEKIIESPGLIRLNYESFTNLEYAADMLSYKEPQEVEIIGFITDLSAKDNPLGLDTSRSIVVRWINKEEDNKVYHIYSELSRNDYLEAINAHQNWKQIKIKGDLQRIGRNWKMVNYSEFYIVNL